VCAVATGHQGHTGDQAVQDDQPDGSRHQQDGGESQQRGTLGAVASTITWIHGHPRGRGSGGSMPDDHHVEIGDGATDERRCLDEDVDPLLVAQVAEEQPIGPADRGRAPPAGVRARRPTPRASSRRSRSVSIALSTTVMRDGATPNDRRTSADMLVCANHQCGREDTQALILSPSGLGSSAKLRP
jgi:hypothetical protein